MHVHIQIFFLFQVFDTQFQLEFIIFISLKFVQGLACIYWYFCALDKRWHTVPMQMSVCGLIGLKFLSKISQQLLIADA